MTYIKKKLGLVWVLGVWIIVGCNGSSKRDFEWPADIAALTGKDLGEWLRQAPFTNELSQKEDNKVVFTNAQQVFPFMGRFHNAVGELRYARNDADNPIYQEEAVLYQDPEWGDLFVSAALLYDAEEVFLDRNYSESGNVLFGGVDAGMDRHTASLRETAVFSRSGPNKAACYWAATAGGSYLLGFFQQGNLVFETAIPLRGTDTLATLNKLKDVSDKLGLEVQEWQQATVAQLAATDKRETFWKDPFTGIYFDSASFLNRVMLKIKDTPFQEVQPAPMGDHYFSYEGTGGLVMFATEVKATSEDREAFDAGNQDLPAYETNGQRLYYEEQPTKGNRVAGIAKTYFNAGQYLEINYAYPQADNMAKAAIHGVLQHVKVRRFL